MSIQLELPQIGEGVEEADVAEILVSVGDVIEANQTVMELETEKAVVELPCPHAGTIEKILVSPGDTIRVGAPVLVIDAGNGADRSQAKDTASADDTESAPPAAQPEQAQAGNVAPPGTEPPTDQPPPPKGQSEAAETEPAKSSQQPESQTAGETEIVEGEIEFQLPPLGEGVNSADVAEIMVSEGDVIEAEDTVMELETEKAVVELPCPHPGKIKKIHVSEGDTIEVGAVVLTIESTSKVASKPEQKPAPASAEKPSRQQQAEKTTAAPEADQRRQPADDKRPVDVSATTHQTAVAQKTAHEVSVTDEQTPVPAAPSTRRLARQLGVNLREVRGSGRGGRITQDDVQSFVRDRLSGSSLPARREEHSGLTLAAGSIAPPPLPDFSKYGIVEREKLNKIARTAAENLTVSWNVIPHVTQHDRADITDLEAARKRFGQGAGKNGPKVTMTAIIMKALARCLQAYPKFNSSLDPETNEIVYKRFFHIGCAVDTPHGLVVPVVRDCDQKSILEIAEEVSDLAGKARDRKLSVDSMQGATCTVTNLGGIGGVAFTPIINYPEVCILGMSRGQKELRLANGQVEERLMLPLSLSYDHRVINGADAARFMVTLTDLLSDPFQLLTTV